MKPYKNILVAIFQCCIATVGFYIMLGILTEFRFGFVETFIDIFPIAILLRILNFFAGSKRL